MAMQIIMMAAVARSARMSMTPLAPIKKEERFPKPKRGAKRPRGYNIISNVELESYEILPYGIINGTLRCKSKNPKIHKGIRIQLEALVSVESRIWVSHPTMDTEEQNILAGVTQIVGDGDYSFSPIGVQINGTPFNELTSASTEDSFTLPEGTSSFPFSFQMTGETLPYPFKRSQNSLEFKIVAYIKDSFYFIKMGEAPVTFYGHHNLCENPKASLPLRHKSEIQFKKSIFSSTTPIGVVLSTERSGFLPGEVINFKLDFINPKCFRLTKVSVNFIRKKTHNMKGVKKMGVSNLDSFEVGEMIDDQVAGWIVGSVRVPRNCVPSYKENEAYNVLHLLEYEMKVAEHPVPLKGQVEIIIGTTRESVESLMSLNHEMSLLQAFDRFPEMRGRSDSMVSRMSDCSVPPAYSQLSSRAVSMLSLATLPPHYDDLKDFT